ncbi:cell wall integrity and stress response component 2-like isoform X2 [Lucilia cuprina]|uniref:cell wall integrity and stress response component 2-like isoform X2 n=1 Tax=Lucilia cuprina TaxID=7375 RepID=UPI001F0651A1|nr:cell wall integrity and stress response component 2-like isoform X2 [Lucilia cuprina]XP_046812166.1 cell wall integrity and stress response component 2-like isoform X2 [Lucilia cuprina]XP_046812172.1 cell wall integrity and stress response component 2-like isoform X2 [Lucilia cuprina]
MESTSEVVWQEQTKSSVTKKSVQEMSATTVQKLSSSSFAGKQSVLSILGSNGDKMTIDGTVMASQSLSPSPIITSPLSTDNGSGINTTSLQSEFSAMKVKDEQGNEIGEIVQQKQEQQSLQASSAVTSLGTSSVKQVSSTASSSVVQQQQSATSLVTKAQETSSSVSSSSFTSTKKQEIVSSSTRSLTSIKSSQSIEKVMKSSASAVVVEDQEF